MLCRYGYCISVFFVLFSVVYGVGSVLKTHLVQFMQLFIYLFIYLFYFMQPQWPSSNYSLCKHISASCNVPAAVGLNIVNSYLPALTVCMHMASI